MLTLAAVSVANTGVDPSVMELRLGKEQRGQGEAGD